MYPFRCCNAQSSSLSSCTNPFSELDRTRLADLCPSPPLVSVSTRMSTRPTGRLDSDNTYIAEHLLREADRAKYPSKFFRKYQAGFVVTSERDPAFSVCGCSNPIATCALFPSFENHSSSECPYYSLAEDAGFCPVELPGCYSVDGVAANYRQQNVYCSSETSSVGMCGEPGQRPVGATYPDQTEQLSVTVWYNNQVCTILCL